MLDRSTIRPNRHYWVKRRESTDLAVIAFVSGELPSLNIKPLDRHSYPSCDQYDFIADADMEKLFESQFHGLTIDELIPAKAK